MKPGPPKKPTVIKELTGNPGRRALNKNEPKPEKCIPPMPKNLGPIAKAEWKRISKILHKMGCLTEADYGLLEVMVHYWEEWCKWSEVARKKPVVKSPKSDYYMITPFVTLSEKALRHYKEIALQFGLSPASRPNISVEKGSGEDIVEDFRNKRLKRVK
jgi:P27 family predicted phage terminase small subunit